MRELRALDKYYQRFRIDDHLKRHEKALQDLNEAGPDRFDEALAYVEKHRLYDAALGIWRGSEQYEVSTSSVSKQPESHSILQTVLDLYGDWLFERREFKEAGFGKCYHILKLTFRSPPCSIPGSA